VGQNGLEDSLQLLVIREGEIEGIELGLTSLRDLGTSSSGRTHSSHQLHIQNVFEQLFLGVVEPSLIVQPLSQNLECTLSAELVLSGHVQIIDEEHGSFPTRHHFVLRSLHQFALNELLHSNRRSLRTEHHRSGAVGIVQVGQKAVQ
jgi:hypothetical protein